MPSHPFWPDRRAFLLGVAATAAALQARATPGSTPQPTLIRAGRGAFTLPGSGKGGELELYGGALPGPVLRFRQGDPATLVYENALERPTGLYLQGIRAPAASAGGEAVQGGGRREIVLTPPDAGTFVYRPESGAGADPSATLAGVLLVEEREPAGFGRDLVLAFSALQARQIDPAAPDGAVLWLANGATGADLDVRPGERVRLRLVNLAPTAPLAVQLDGAPVTVLAIDGQPSEAMRPADPVFLLGPFGRLDLGLDIPRDGARLPVSIDGGAGMRAVAALVPSGEPVEAADRAPIGALPANPFRAEVPLTKATRLDLVLADTAPAKAAAGTVHLLPNAAAAARPLRVKPGATVSLAVANRTGHAFSVHWQGHPARLLDGMDDGWKPWWVDSVLVPPGETRRVAFVAGSAGRWLITAQALGRAADRRSTSFEVG